MIGEYVFSYLFGRLVMTFVVDWAFRTIYISYAFISYVKLMKLDPLIGCAV